MKYDVITRHYKEGRPVLKAADNLVCFLILIFILNPGLSAQININGFCEVKTLSTAPGMTGIHQVEINEDGIPDILLTNDAIREVSEIHSSDSTSFKQAVNKYISHPVTDLKYFNNLEGQQSYLLISRKDKACMSIGFTKHGSIKQLKNFQFNTLPGVLVVGDVTGDSLNEAFICGPSFDGISEIYYDSSNHISIRSIVNKRMFSDLKIADLDYDGLPDLAAVDMIDGEIKILSNEGEGYFSEQRAVELTELPQHIILKDMNSDGFIDLIYSSEDGINYSLGDSVSTFNKFHKINLTEKPLKLLTGDFNSDGIYDFAYLGNTTGNLTLVLSNGEQYSEWKQNSTVYVDMIINENGDIILLSKNGKVQLLSRSNTDVQNFCISAADSYSAMHLLNIGSPGYTDIAFLDKKNTELKVIQSDSRQIFNRIYQYPLSADFTDFYLENENLFLKEFYFFTPGQKLIELLKIDFENNSFNKEQLYSYYPILDLKVLKNQETGLNDINIIAGNSEYTGIVKFFHRGIKYQLGELDTLTSGVVKTKFLLNDPLKAAFIQKSADTTVLSSLNFLSGPGKALSVIREDTLGSFTYTYLCDKFSTDDFFLFKNKDTLKQITNWNERVIDLADINDKESGLKSSDKFFKVPFKGRFKGLYKIDDDSLPETIKAGKIFESERIIDYFVTSFADKYYLTYTLDNSNFIYFYELK